jgi:hypothetical protein
MSQARLQAELQRERVKTWRQARARHRNTKGRNIEQIWNRKDMRNMEERKKGKGDRSDKYEKYGRKG